MKKTLLPILFLSLLFCATSIGQNNTNSKKYNIPPGSVMRPKAEQLIDYSYKINEIPVENPKNPAYYDFLEDWTKEDLQIIKDKEPETYAYYLKAEAYHKSLSNKVKVTFSYEELWYIYMFDEQLKNKLSTIK